MLLAFDQDNKLCFSSGFLFLMPRSKCLPVNPCLPRNLFIGSPREFKQVTHFPSDPMSEIPDLYSYCIFTGTCYNSLVPQLSCNINVYLEAQLSCHVTIYIYVVIQPSCNRTTYFALWSAENQTTVRMRYTKLKKKYVAGIGISPAER